MTNKHAMGLLCLFVWLFAKTLYCPDFVHDILISCSPDIVPSYPSGFFCLSFLVVEGICQCLRFSCLWPCFSFSFDLHRREAGNCQICWTAELADVELSGAIATGGLTKTTKGCCGYGTKGTAMQFDCLMIPGAKNPAGVSLAYSGMCGRGAGLVSKSTIAAVTLCCK